jgi:hypothetical protein
MTNPNDISYFARTAHRDDRRPFGIKQDDRLSHFYAIGKTGTGKTTLLETLAQGDIDAGRGLALIDPHGDLAERVAAYAAKVRPNDLVYLDVPDPMQPFGYNPLKRVPLDKVPLAVSGLMEALKKHWSDAWGVRMEHVLRNALFALLEHGHAKLDDILRMLNDQTYRKNIAAKLENEPVRVFWQKEFEKYSFRYRADAIAPIQNKIGAFLADPTLRRILTEPKEMLRFRRLMDESKVVVVNLARGKVGDDSAALLGSLLVTTIGLAAFSRADIPEAKRLPFFLYMDEFQTFTTLSVAGMISELRKYKVGLILANQHLHQLEPDIRYAVLGNAGTLVSFRTGPDDAIILAREFAPRFEMLDLMNLANHNIYLKLMIDGAPSQPFSATTIAPQSG